MQQQSCYGSCVHQLSQLCRQFLPYNLLLSSLHSLLFFILEDYYLIIDIYKTGWASFCILDGGGFAPTETTLCHHSSACFTLLAQKTSSTPRRPSSVTDDRATTRPRLTDNVAMRKGDWCEFPPNLYLRTFFFRSHYIALFLTAWDETFWRRSSALFMNHFISIRSRRMRVTCPTCSPSFLCLFNSPNST